MLNPEMDAQPVMPTGRQYPLSGRASATLPSSMASRALRARIGLAAAHDAELLVPGAVVGKVVYLDDRGSPVVLHCGEAPFPTGRAGLRVNLLDGGHLTLLGGAAEARFNTEEARRIGAMLVGHRHCLTGLLPQRGAFPVRFEIETVLISRARPGARVQTLPATTPETIALVDYAEAEPDLFAELSAAALAHVSDDHQDLLIAVARRQSGQGDVIGVGARDGDAGGLTLDLVGPDGSTALPLRFPSDLTHPHQLGPALRALACEGPS
jgi:hypothetical protein